MSYESVEPRLVANFADKVKKGEIILENQDLKFSKQISRYNKYLASITKVHPRSYRTKEFMRIKEQQLLEISLYVIINIFGEKVIPIVLDYYKHLCPSNADEILDGINITAVNQETNEVIKLVEVPDLETTSNIVTIVHEFVHYYLEYLKIPANKQRYYDEILSIYAEKIAKIMVEEITHERNYSSRIEEQRLETILWHYKQNLPSAICVADLYSELKRRSINSRLSFTDVINIQQLEQQFPFIKQSNGVSLLKGYYKNMADSYGIGYLYSESLLARYLDDKKVATRELGKYLSSEQTLEELLSYYNISTNNPETFEIAKKKIESIKRK